MFINLFDFETGFPVAYRSLELGPQLRTTLDAWFVLLPSFDCCDCRQPPPYLAFAVLGIELRVSTMMSIGFDQPSDTRSPTFSILL